MNKQQSAKLPDIFGRALTACRTALAPEAGLAIALSGGLDSSVLLHLAHDYAQQHQFPLFAFHIHHGLSGNADAWLTHCAHACAQLGIPFEARHIALEKKAKSGIEEAARKHRYAALGQLCREHGVSLLLTAHHQDDQAETVLLQLLRGCGTAGLSGMDGANAAPALLSNPDLVMARPLLTVARRQLETYVASHAIAYIDDESNADARFARNALRHQVMPVLAQCFPGFQERLARSARHAQSAQRLLTELAAQDLALCLDGEGIDLSQLRLLSADRSYNLLRYWFSLRQLRMPSAAWLEQMVAQLLQARPDAQVLVSHPDCHVRRHRDRLYLTPRLAALAGSRDEDDDEVQPGLAFTWQGQAQIAFPEYGGVLHFDSNVQGLDPVWLGRQTLLINFRQGGERLKLAANRPTKSLKYHYQAANVPAWERERLPIVSIKAHLLFAAGIGMDCHHLSPAPLVGTVLRWVTA